MAFLLCLSTRRQTSGVRQFATVAARMPSPPRRISYRASRVDVVSESSGHERCGLYLHLLSRSATESTPRSCPAVGLEEPQEGLDRSQLHNFEKQMISQRLPAAHNATQDHIRLRTEPFLDLQQQAGRRTWRRGILPRACSPTTAPCLAYRPTPDDRIAKCYAHTNICAIE